jgi:hypothetical protein
MKSILINLTNFTLVKQCFIIDNNKVMNVEEITSLDNNTINKLATKYDIKLIEFVGNKDYVLGLIKHLQEENNTQFNMNIELKYREI